MLGIRYWSWLIKKKLLNKTREKKLCDMDSFSEIVSGLTIEFQSEFERGVSPKPSVPSDFPQVNGT